MTLTNLRTLGRSGLPVSPLALGAMTFGTPDWGSPDDVSKAIFNAYVDAGGNFIDTADIYSGGRSEELVGDFISRRKLRDQIVLATKYSWNSAAHPLAGGNNRKNLYRALDGSLRCLQTDYVDLYWMHVWDQVTPVEEVLQTMGDLVRAGKIRYFGFSDVPAWYVTRAATLAQVHNVPGPIALQPEYSLTERTIEQEHVPAMREMGIGITPWAPLAFGFLTGKYRREEDGKGGTGSGRLGIPGTHFQKFTERNWQILDTLRAVSDEAGLPLAQIALAWTLARPGITSLLVGASKVEQIQANIASLGVVLTPEQTARLNEVSAPESTHPYNIFAPEIQRSIFAGASVTGWGQL